VFGRKKREQERQLFQNGARAIGTVMHVKDTGMLINDNPRVKMTFRIEPLDGSAPFQAEKTKTVYRYAVPRAGDRYPVWYDPGDHEVWAYATVEDEMGVKQIRELFGPGADKLTGIMSALPTTQMAPPQPAVVAQPDPIEQIRQLNELRTAGVLTDEEFQRKKTELLAQL
jgi:Short C-terminal domain